LDNPYDKHERLFSDTGLKLGKCLWYMLAADQEIARKMYEGKTNSTGFGIRTAFGEEVGKDEIHWWVYKKESHIEELQGNVKLTLCALQDLKEATSNLEPYGIQTYADLLTCLTTFVEAHKEQINDLYEFVVWLHGRDSLAPSILFTYRVWGATRRSDRRLELNGTNIDAVSDEVIEELTVIACGLADRRGYRRHSEAMNIGAELYDSDPETFRSQDIPEGSIVQRTAYKALTECSVFFEQLRESLRNIDIDIEKYLAEKNLLKSESFWKRFILKAKEPGRIEPELWDFKESLPMWHASGAAAQKAQVDFCRLVAAFANKDGGAIIIGVTDKSRAVQGVPNLENRMKSTSGVMHKWLDYPRKETIIRLQQVPFEQSGEVSTCLVVAVAQAAEVVGVKGVDGAYYYPDRDQTGVVNSDRRELATRKSHLKSGDNFGFVKELEEFLHDK